MLNRWVEEDGLLDTLDGLGIGSIVFSPLAQGMLTDKYLGGVPEGSRAAQGKSLRPASSTTRTSPTSARSTPSPSGAARPWRRWRWPGCCAAAA
jgi:aryl-alcohol dehydrogenase-like predicted oxidoreductase